MKTFCTLCFPLMLGLLCLPAFAEPPDPDFHLYLLAGQSNMAGRGKVESEHKAPHPRVLMLDKNNTWVPAIDPMHFDKPGAGVGPGRSFGIAMAEANPKVKIGLIPCAAGGSSIERWVPGGYHDQTKSHPYDDALRRTREAMKHGTLKGICWHQGESDASKIDTYPAKLTELVARFRKELNAPGVPFVAGELGLLGDPKREEAYRRFNAMLRGAVGKIENAAWVSSSELKDKGDQLHFDSPSAQLLGRRYAEAMQKLLNASR